MSISKTLFINIPAQIDYIGSPIDASLEHIGLGYLAAYLKERGIEVKLIDAHSRRLSEIQIFGKIKEYNPKFLCVSPTYYSWNLTISLLKKTKKTYPEIVTIAGGSHVSFDPILTGCFKKYNCFDFVVKGDGEIALCKIINNFLERNPFQKIKGVSYRDKNGNVHIDNNYAEIIDNLDRLPFPLHDIEPIKNQYLRICTSRGCYKKGHGCTFCNSSEMNPEGWRFRSASNVVNEIELWHSKGFKNFICAESEFLGINKIGLERGKKIADEIAKRKLKLNLRIFCGVRQIIQADKIGLLMDLQKAGVERIYPGIEAGNDKDLSLYNKHINTTMCKEAIKILEDRNFGIQIGFIMFHPWSDIKSIEQNINFLREIKQAHLWYHFFKRMALFPGNKMYNLVKKNNLFFINENEVSFGEDFAFNYKFVNLEIEKLSKLNKYFETKPSLIQTNRALISADIFFSKLSKEEKTISSKMGQILNEYIMLKEKIANINIKTFRKLLRICFRSSFTIEAEKILDRYNSEIEEIHEKIFSILVKFGNNNK